MKPHALAQHPKSKFSERPSLPNSSVDPNLSSHAHPTSRQETSPVNRKIFSVVPVQTYSQYLTLTPKYIYIYIPNISDSSERIWFRDFSNSQIEIQE